MIPYALFNSKIVFEPFQYKPFFEFFENTREDLYIADEVGVGKTIEAGIIISELINANREATWIKESLNNVEFPRILILAPRLINLSSVSDEAFLELTVEDLEIEK